MLVSRNPIGKLSRGVSQAHPHGPLPKRTVTSSSCAQISRDQDISLASPHHHTTPYSPQSPSRTKKHLTDTLLDNNYNETDICRIIARLQKPKLKKKPVPPSRRTTSLATGLDRSMKNIISYYWHWHRLQQLSSVLQVCALLFRSRFINFNLG